MMVTGQSAPLPANLLSGVLQPDEAFRLARQDHAPLQEDGRFSRFRRIGKGSGAGCVKVETVSFRGRPPA